MANRVEAQNKTKELTRVANLLGGTRTLGRQLKSPLDAHEVLLRGLPGEAVTHLVDRLVSLDLNTSFENVVGMSLRTFQRRKAAGTKPLNQQQSARAWKFAETLAKATEVFGSQEEAEQWLQRPAIGLDGRRPIDLLATPAGVDLVEDFLTRLKYGVYV